MTDAPVSIDELLAELTLEERCALTAGSDAWHTTAVPRLGIPTVKVTDGPNGARGDGASGERAACFPVGSALASSWDRDLIRRVGAALALEARTKGAQVLLGPTVNIHRTPLAGRNFECYSEDPYLSGEIATAFIEGVQSNGIGACIKHLVANDSEFERHTISSEVTERTLREIYLRPFEIAVRRADPWTLMAAYNRVNGTYACAHRWLLTEVLRDEWGWNGVVISDWGAVQDTVGTARAGLDLEMPGPAVHLGEGLAGAVRVGDVDEAIVDRAAERLLRLTRRTGRFDDPEERPERSVDRPEDRDLARQAAIEGMVLLKNDLDALPLDLEMIDRLAVIGPNAEVGQFQGGGSSQVVPHHVSHPLAAIRGRLEGRMDIVHEPGCHNERYLPEIPRGRFEPGRDGGRGVHLEYFDSPDLGGVPTHTRDVSRLGAEFFGFGVPGIDPGRFSCRYRATFVPGQTGTHRFGVMATGRSRVLVDGREVIDNWTDPRPGDWQFGWGTEERTGTVELRGGHPVEIVVEYGRDADAGFPGVRVGLLDPVPADMLERAVAAAGDADAAVVVVGTSGDWETEGADRRDMDLPGDQDELIRRVTDVQPTTVVALNAGSPVTVTGWIDAAPAVLQIWFAGQELGEALTDVLVGEAEPGGRLPTTFPLRLEDNPGFLSYPGEGGEVVYGEGVFVGYRAYDESRLAVAFPFGHGLGYTTFEYGEARARPGGGGMAVEVEVTNTGARAGREVVQVYVSDPEAPVRRPPRELKGFTRIRLEPGEGRTVLVELDDRAFQYWDPDRGTWRSSGRPQELQIGRSSRDIRVRVPLTFVDE